MAINADVIQNQSTISDAQATDTAEYMDTGGVYTALPDQVATVDIDRFFTWVKIKNYIAHWLGIKGVVENLGKIFDSGDKTQLQQTLDERDGFRGLYATTNPTELWVAGTYGAGVVKRYLGRDWYVNAVSTTDTPGANTDWKPVKRFADKLEGWKTAGWGDIFDPKSANVVNYVRIGQYKVGDKNIDRYAVNCSGQNTGLNTEDFYKLVDNAKDKATFAIFDTDHYILQDYRGCVISSGDASGGYRANNGTRQAHASQKKKGTYDLRSSVGSLSTQNSLTGVFSQSPGTGTNKSSINITENQSGDIVTLDTAGQTGQTYNTSGDGLGNEGSDPGENYSNNVANGCGIVEVDIEVGIISTLVG